MGPENEYTGEIEHPQLGTLSWLIVEYPVGSENYKATDINGHILLEDFDYGLKSAPEDYRHLLNILVSWFRNNFENPANNRKYNTQFGSYEWKAGEPYDAMKTLSKHFPSTDIDTIRDAVNIIDPNNNSEWSSKDNDFYLGSEYEIDGATNNLPAVPNQLPGISFVVGDEGKIEAVQSGLASEDERQDIQTLCTEIDNALTNLLDQLKGTNSYTDIAEIAFQYKKAVSIGPLSVDLVFAHGNLLQNFNQRLSAQIESGDYPEMAPNIGATLDTIIALHGIVIASTERGKILLQRDSDFKNSGVLTTDYQKEAQKFVEVVADNLEIATDDALQKLRQANKEINEGPYRDRSTTIAITANSNFLITAAKYLIKRLADGALKAAGAASFLAFSSFFLDNLPFFLEFATVSGPYLAWLTPFLDWILGIFI